VEGSTREAVYLLMRLPEEERPDGLVVWDDNLVPEATAGLVKAGIDVGRDLDVVGHANFPNVTPSRADICRIGFDVHELLERCVQTLDEIRAGHDVPNTMGRDAIFEQDYLARS